MNRQGLVILLVILFTLSGLLFTQTTSNVLSQLPRDVTIIKPKPRNIPILLYHYVEYITNPEDTSRVSLTIFPNVFEMQILALKEAGYVFITPKDIPKALRDVSDQKYVILSFDDGYRTFYDYAYPILKKNNVPAVNYVVSGLLNQTNYLFGWQVKEMADSGLVEIGLHGYNHRSVTSMSKEELRMSLTTGKEILKDLTGKEPVSYAYPYGTYTDEAVEVLKELSLKTAVTIEQGSLVKPDDLYHIPRIRPGGLTGESLIKRLELRP